MPYAFFYKGSKVQDDNFFHIYAFYSSILFHTFCHIETLTFLHCIWPFFLICHNYTGQVFLQTRMVCIYHCGRLQDRDEDRRFLFYVSKFFRKSEALNLVLVKGFGIFHSDRSILAFLPCINFCTECMTKWRWTSTSFLFLHLTCISIA